MASVTVGGQTIKVAPGGIQRPRFDNVDRSRVFDNSYKASVSGTPKRDWDFSTPPVIRSVAEFYENILSSVASLPCSGDIIGGSNNLVLWSEGFDNAVWTKTASTVLPDVGVAPNGTGTPDKIQEDNTNAQHIVIQSVTGAQATYVFSVWLHAAERTKAVVGMYDGVLGVASIGVNLSNGTTFASGLGVGAWTGISGTVSENFGDWYRVTLIANRNAGTATWPVIYIADAAGAVSYLGTTGSGIYAWGAQLEIAVAATPYIQTTTVARNTLTVSCCPEITGWSPVRLGTGHAVVLDFVLHEV